MKNAIKNIIPCFASNTKLKTFEDFLSIKLLAYHGFKRGHLLREENHCDYVIHDYMISDGITEYDVFKKWSSSFLDKL